MRSLWLRYGHLYFILSFSNMTIRQNHKSISIKVQKYFINRLRNAELHLSTQIAQQHVQLSTLTDATIFYSILLSVQLMLIFGTHYNFTGTSIFIISGHSSLTLHLSRAFFILLRLASYLYLRINVQRFLSLQDRSFPLVTLSRGASI